jgi:hypothetical protein
MWLLIALAVLVNVALVAVLVVGSHDSDASVRSAPTCAKAVQRLAAHLDSLAPAQPSIDAKIARASFRACATPDAWRVRAERADIGPALGRLVNDPGLATDRALDALCTHLDPYDTTGVCRAHQGASLSS